MKTVRKPIMRQMTACIGDLATAAPMIDPYETIEVPAEDVEVKMDNSMWRRYKEPLATWQRYEEGASQRLQELIKCSPDTSVLATKAYVLTIYNEDVEIFTDKPMFLFKGKWTVDKKETDLIRIITKHGDIDKYLLWEETNLNDILF